MRALACSVKQGFERREKGNGVVATTLIKHCLINLLCTSKANSANPKSFSSTRRTPSNVNELHSNAKQKQNRYHKNEDGEEELKKKMRNYSDCSLK